MSAIGDLEAPPGQWCAAHRSAAGKLFARFIVGIAQMAWLFAIGWAMYAISLGRNPLALIVPKVGISFAAAALALVVASIATAHDRCRHWA